VTAAVDANILLYASDATSEFHDRARTFLEDLARRTELVYLFWPTVMAYLRIATHPAIFAEPLDPDEAIANLEALLDLPHVQTPGEGQRFWPSFRSVAEDGPLRGNTVPDAHLVALMREHGIRVLWTSDRGFRRYREIESRDPFA
jgi:toxin-antitoxin system PIN domain toxin